MQADTSAVELGKEQLKLQKEFNEKSLDHFAQHDINLNTNASNMQRMRSAVKKMCDLIQ